jgi:hypothetical protein
MPTSWHSQPSSDSTKRSSSPFLKRRIGRREQRYGKKGRHIGAAQDTVICFVAVVVYRVWTGLDSRPIWQVRDYWRGKSLLQREATFWPQTAGRVCILWSTCDGNTKSHNAPRSVLERVEIGKVSVGVWHVAQLKGCSRTFWHHVSLKGAQSEGADARQQHSLWQLQVLSKTGGLELDMWRTEPIHPSQSAAAKASTKGNEGERGRPTDDEVDRLRHTKHRGEAQTTEIGGLEMSKVRGGGAGEGVAEELDAHTIAQRWDVDKVQAFLATFRDEFGDEATGTQFSCFTRTKVQILTRLRRRDIPANLPQRADRRGYATSAQLRRPDGHRPPLHEPYPPHTSGRRRHLYVCSQTAIYVSSCCVLKLQYICVLRLLYMCVLILLYTCPRTTIYVIRRSRVTCSHAAAGRTRSACTQLLAALQACQHAQWMQCGRSSNNCARTSGRAGALSITLRCDNAA